MIIYENKRTSHFIRLRYKQIGVTGRRFFKYTATVARIVPICQRLVIDEGWVEKTGWREKYTEDKKNNPNCVLRYEDKYTKVKVDKDYIIYHDKDLEKMAEFREAWVFPNDAPVVNTAKILNQIRDELKKSKKT